MIIEKPIAELPIVFTAQSKLQFFCRDAICEFVFNQGAVPVNPFRLYGYFLADRVDRDLVRQANNNLIRNSDQLWVFGDTIADGVLFEIEYARRLNKPVRFYTVDSRADRIVSLSFEKLAFEPGVYSTSGLMRKQLLEKISA